LLPLTTQIIVYRDAEGHEPFPTWVEELDPQAAAKVSIALKRMAAGNLGDVKPVGEGVSERRIDWGPGYRVYFGQDGAQLIVLVGGGTKKGQQQDIATAKARWADYKRRRSMMRSTP
jgi:putative addiction module killer protein